MPRRPREELTDDSCSQEESSQICKFTSHHLAPVDVVKATCQYHMVEQDEPSLPPCLIESLAIHPDAILAAFQEEDSFKGLSKVPKYSDTVRLQQADPDISGIKVDSVGRTSPCSTSV